MPNKHYLGDAVYVLYDGYDIILTTEDGVSVFNTIVLEDKVLYNLLEYLYRNNIFKENLKDFKDA